MNTAIIRADAARIAQQIDLAPLDGKRVIITGATGLIGTYLTAVLEEGVRTGIDMKVTLVARSFQNVKDWDIGQHFGHHLADLVRNAVDLPIADVIFHAAGYGQPAKFMESGLDTILLNTTVLTRLVMGHLAKGGTLLYTSSSEVYSGINYLPKEDDIGTTTPQHPRANYIEAKRCGEAICGYADARLGGRCVVARVALAYGPGTRPGDSRVINEFIRDAIVNKCIKLRDHGLAWRTYCYVSDTVEMLLHAALYGKQKIYNIGGRSGVAIHALARMIGKMTDCEVHIPTCDVGAIDESGAPNKVDMDIRRVTDEMHKAHFVDLQVGLERTIRYQQELYA